MVVSPYNIDIIMVDSIGKLLLNVSKILTHTVFFTFGTLNDPSEKVGEKLYVCKKRKRNKRLDQDKHLYGIFQKLSKKIVARNCGHCIDTSNYEWAVRTSAS